MTRIFIENYELELTAEISQQLTFSIDDIRNLDSKTTSFSKTIVIAGTDYNNKIFGNIYELSNANFPEGSVNAFYNFDASKSAQARIEINGLQAMKGIMRLLSITIDRGNIDYEVALFGELGGLISAIGNKRLTDLDFSSYDHEWNEVNISSSWAESGEWNITTGYDFGNPYTPVSEKYMGVYPLTIMGANLSSIQPFDQITITGTTNNDGVYSVLEVFWIPAAVETLLHLSLDNPTTPETGSTCNIKLNTALGYGYVYPLIDYGVEYPPSPFIKLKDWSFRNFRPAFFVLDYINKIITDAGYTWESKFLNTDFFRRLIIPNNDIGLEVRDQSFYLDSECGVLNYDLITTNAIKINFDTNNINNGFTIAGTNDLFTFSTNDIKNVKIKLSLQGTIRKPFYSTIRLIIYKNNEQLNEFDLPEPLKPFNDKINVQLDFNTSIKQNDKISIQIIYKQGYYYEYDFTTDQFVKTYVTTHTYLDIDQAKITIEQEPAGFIQYSYGDLLKVNNLIPKNVFQKDFLTSIMKMFNLLIVERKDKTKHLVIEPYIEFYKTEIETYQDWSNKVNRDKPIIIKPMSEINARYFNFKLKDDSDYFNDLYKKKFNETYGNRIFDNNLEFAKENQSVEVIFSPSILFGKNGEDKVFSVIYKYDDTNKEQPIAHNIRIMLYKLITDVNEWHITQGGTALNNYNYYPYAGHLNNPDFPTIDINWGATKQLYFELVSGSLQYNQFNNFYSPYFAEIIDKDSRLVTCEMKLSETDIFNLDFSRYKMIDGVLFRLIKIYDWSEGALCKVDLLRVINTTYLPDSPYSSKVFRMRFDNIVNADGMIGGSSSNIDDWNNFFGLSSTNKFSSVYVEGNDVLLIGKCELRIAGSLFKNQAQILGIWDNIGCVSLISDSAFADSGIKTFSSNGLIKEVQTKAFENCSDLYEVLIPNCLFLNDSSFVNANNLRYLDFSGLENADANAFTINTKNIQLTTNNFAVSTDGIQFLINNNNVSLIIV